MTEVWAYLLNSGNIDIIIALAFHPKKIWMLAYGLINSVMFQPKLPDHSIFLTKTVRSSLHSAPA